VLTVALLLTLLARSLEGRCDTGANSRGHVCRSSEEKLLDCRDGAVADEPAADEQRDVRGVGRTGHNHGST
jgi:hypothetical protein